MFGKACACLAAVCALVAGVGYSWKYASIRPSPVTEFEGVKLGASITDVTVALGAPSSSFRNNTLVFVSKGLVAEFKTGRSRTLTILCAYDDETELLGFGHHSTEADIVKKLGRPDKTSFSRDGLNKKITYRKWNVGYSIRNNLSDVRCMTSVDLAIPNEILPTELENFDVKNLAPAGEAAVAPDAVPEMGDSDHKKTPDSAKAKVADELPTAEEALSWPRVDPSEIYGN